MSGTVGLIANQSARYTLFPQSLTGLFAQLPMGTVVDWEIGGDQARGRNTVVRRALERGSEWVLFLDDDHSFPPTILDVLLSRNVPVVSCLYLNRADPFLPIAYAEKDEEGNYWPLDLSQCPEHGLVQVRAVGAGGLLIKTDVLRQIGDPWFLHTTEQSEDIYFCEQLFKHEIPLYVDLDAPLGHVVPISIYPDFEGGQWTAGLATSATMKVCLPINAPLEDEPAGDPEQFLSPQDPSPEPDQDPGPIPIATRVEMFPDAEGRWYARGVTEEGLVVDHQDGVFNQEDAEILARAHWPGLPIFIVADANADSTFIESEQMRMGLGQPDRSPRKSLSRMYGNR